MPLFIFRNTRCGVFAVLCAAASRSAPRGGSRATGRAASTAPGRAARSSLRAAAPGRASRARGCARPRRSSSAKPSAPQARVGALDPVPVGVGLDDRPDAHPGARTRAAEVVRQRGAVDDGGDRTRHAAILPATPSTRGERRVAPSHPRAITPAEGRTKTASRLRRRPGRCGTGRAVRRHRIRSVRPAPPRGLSAARTRPHEKRLLHDHVGAVLRSRWPTTPCSSRRSS